MSRHRIAAALMLGTLIVMVFATSDAVAQRPAPRTRRDAHPLEAYLPADCLDGSNFCRFVSEDVPAGGLLEINRVACQGWHINATLPSFVVIAELRTSSDAFVGRIDFLKASYTSASGGNVWAISEQTLMFIAAGHRLRISRNSGPTGTGSYGCTISGYLTVA